MSPTQQLKEEILSHIHALDIAGYLTEEATNFLSYVKYYKLKNILQHIEELKEYLLHLDEQNTQQISWLMNYCKGEDQHVDSTLSDYLHEHSMDYFLGNHAMDVLGEDRLTSFFTHNVGNYYHVSTIMLRIKGLFLLSANEFCHASTTRICLHKQMVQKQSFVS